MIADANASNHEPSLAELRHTAAHVLAYAVQDLFPEAKPTIGPAIENGFYYDFDRAEAFTPDDLARLEARMNEIVAADYPMTGREVTRSQVGPRSHESFVVQRDAALQPDAAAGSHSRREPRASRQRADPRR